MSGGFPGGDGHFDMEYIKEPQKVLGTFISEDYQKMSTGLANVGLKCGENTPEKNARISVLLKLPNHYT